jgi:undecaprenyl-diphosphatase
MPADFLYAIGRLDLMVFQWLRTYHSPFLDMLMAAASDVTRGGALWIGLALLFAATDRRRWPGAAQVLLAIGMSSLLTETVAKPLFNRARPFESYADMRVYGYRPMTRSLPSGHVANATAAAYALTRVVPNGRAVFWTVALLVAFSRVYLGVHYPIDVIVGGVSGFGIAAFVIGGTRWSQR